LIPLKVNLARATCPIGRWNRDPVSVLIPARNELYLFRTILDLQTNAAGPIDIWIFADSWNDHRDVLDRVLAMDSNSVHVVVNDGPAVGIRRASNHLADLAPGPYLYRVDAHCAFSPAWDIALKNAADPKTVVVPAMRILDPVAWTAERGGGNYYYIDQDFRYKTLPGVRAKAAVVEIMVFIGAAWFCRKTTWQALGGYDDRFYKWGESGVEWSLKTWLNGGRLVLDRRSWFAHWFRGKFPYAISGKKIESNRTAIREYYQNYHGERSVKWLVRKFKPLPGWHFEATPEGTPENGSKTQ
jgi:glycosyltransferase involved in cell wall biosynthesis